MKDTKYGFYIGSFETYGSAQYIVARAKEIAKDYGYATVVDVCDLCGENSEYEDNFNGWTLDALDRGVIRRAGDGSTRIEYKLYLPTPNLHRTRKTQPISKTVSNCIEKKPHKDISININIPSAHYAIDPDRYDRVIKEALNKATGREHAIVVINYT